jgi:integrase
VLPRFIRVHTVRPILLPKTLPHKAARQQTAGAGNGTVARFTDKSIAALRPKAERFEVWEGGGFGLRISPRGIKSWIWVYRFDGRTRRMTFGTYPAMGLADARVKLADARKLLGQGIDPAESDIQSRKADRASATVAELAEAYLDKWARPRKRSAAEDERILRKDVLPAWRRRKAQDITRKDVIAMLDAIVDRGSPIAANRTLAVVRRMFGWALSRDIVPANPCGGVKAPSKETRRDRILNADEIVAVWRALESPEIPISRPIGLALKLQLVTSQRKGEVIEARWEEFDFNERMWTISGARSKNGLAHRVPLSPLAMTVLEEIRALPSSEFLFASPRRTDRPITGPAVDHAVRNNRDVLGTGDATPHDLRRTAASHMTSIGVSRLVVSKILNHAEPGVTAVYDRHSYDREKRAALEAWGARLEGIIGIYEKRPKILPLRTSA